MKMASKINKKRKSEMKSQMKMASKIKQKKTNIMWRSAIMKTQTTDYLQTSQFNYTLPRAQPFKTSILKISR